MQLLQPGAALLLELSLRFSDLQCLHGGESLGPYLQRRELAVSRLRGSEAFLKEGADMGNRVIDMGHRKVEDPALHVVLYRPEIPANTGNIARLCGAAEIRLHLIHPLGFRLDDRHLKRAGLDYWPAVDVEEHASLEAFLRAGGDRGRPGLVGFSRHAPRKLPALRS